MNTLPPELIVEICVNLDYSDLIQNACVSKHICTSLNGIWKFKSELEFPDLNSYWRNKEPFNTFSDQKYYLWLYSQEDVARGSEQFKSLNVCLNTSIKLNNPNLEKYFLNKGATWSLDHVKELIKYGRLELIKPLSERLTSFGIQKSLVRAAKYNQPHIIDHFIGIMLYYPEISYLDYILIGAVRGCHDGLISKYNLKSININQIRSKLVLICAKYNYVTYLEEILRISPDELKDDLEGMVLIGRIRGGVTISPVDVLSYIAKITNVMEFICDSLVAAIKANNSPMFDYFMKLIETSWLKLDRYGFRKCLHLAFDCARVKMVKRIFESKLFDKVLKRDGFSWILKYLYDGFCLGKHIWNMAKMCNEITYPNLKIISNNYVIYDYKHLINCGHKDFILYYLKNCNDVVKERIVISSIISFDYDIAKMCIGHLTETQVSSILEKLKSGMSEYFYLETLDRIYG